MFVFRLTSELDTEFFKELDIHGRKHDRGVYLAALKLGKLSQGFFCNRIRSSAHGQGNENLVSMETGIFASEIGSLLRLNGLNGRGCDQVGIMGDFSQYLDGI